MDDLTLRRNWKRVVWNDHGRQEQLKYLSLTEDELINELRNCNFGEHYMIWTAIKLKGTNRMIVPLFESVKLFNTRHDFLKRFHATDALFYLLELDDAPLENQITGNIMLFDKVMFEKGLAKLDKLIKRKCHE